MAACATGAIVRRYSSPCAQSPRSADRSVEYGTPGGTMGGGGKGFRQLRTGAAQQARAVCLSSRSPCALRTKRQSCANVSARLDLGRRQRIRPRLRAHRPRPNLLRLRASASPVAHATHAVSRVSGDHIQPAHTQTRRRPRIPRRRTPVPSRWTLEKRAQCLRADPPAKRDDAPQPAGASALGSSVSLSRC